MPAEMQAGAAFWSSIYSIFADNEEVLHNEGEHFLYQILELVEKLNPEASWFKLLEHQVNCNNKVIPAAAQRVLLWVDTNPGMLELFATTEGSQIRANPPLTLTLTLIGGSQIRANLLGDIKSGGEATHAAKHKIDLHVSCLNLLFATVIGESADSEIKVSNMVPYQACMRGVLEAPRLLPPENEAIEVRNVDEVADEISTQFARYDLDKSGTINSGDEMMQLTTNLCIKLSVTIPFDEVNKLVIDSSAYQQLEHRPLDYEEYAKWFLSTFIPELSGESTPLAAAASALQIRGAHVRIWHEAYVTVGTKENRKHVIATTSRIWPNSSNDAVFTGWNYEEPTCIMEEFMWCMKALTQQYKHTTKHGTSMHHYTEYERSLEDYFFEAIYPAMVGFFKFWGSQEGAAMYSDDDLDEKLIRDEVIEQIQLFLLSLFDVMPDEVSAKNERKLMELYEVELFGLCQEISFHQAMKIKSPEVIRQERLQKGWIPFTQALAYTLGIRDMRRMIGVGIRNTARMLSQNDIKNIDGGVIKSRNVVAAMIKMMSDNPAALQHDADTLAKCLRIGRAMIYLDDPNDVTGARIEDNWAHFMADEAPSHIAFETLHWAQNKQNYLDAPKALMLTLTLTLILIELSRRSKGPHANPNPNHNPN